MKEIVFNKNDYKSYKDMYEDMAHKLECDKIEDYFNSKTMEYSGDILWEVLETDFGYLEKIIKIILIGFNKDEIRLQKNFDDYKYNIILEVFEDFVKKFPNNKLEFKNDDK